LGPGAAVAFADERPGPPTCGGLRLRSRHHGRATKVALRRGGSLYALDIIDGATIKPLIGEDGRAPEPPDPAYQQILKGIPAADFKLIEARQPPLEDQYDECLARIICYAFSVAVSPFVSQVNRATGETMRQQAMQEGLVPLKRWLKNALDHVIQECMNEPGLEFVWVGDDAVDPLEQAQTLQILVGAGIKTREEARPRKASQTLLRRRTPHPVRAPTPAFPGPRTKREHFVDRLRGLPTRADIHDLELRLGERLDSLAVRFDHAFDPHFS
jgi:hypothetical protein